jgi:hypothetical protein
VCPQDEGFRSRELGLRQQQDIMRADTQTHEFSHPLHSDQERLPKPLDSSIYKKAGSAQDTKFEGTGGYMAEKV